MNEEYFTDSKMFFDAIKSYAKEISGTVLTNDQCGFHMPESGCYIGFVVYYDNDKGEDERSKNFLINVKHLVGCDSLIWEALQSSAGKQNLARALSYNGSFVEVFLKPHEGFDEIKVPRGIVNLTIEMLENGERFCKESGEPHGESKYKLLVKALRVALEKHDVMD